MGLEYQGDFTKPIEQQYINMDAIVSGKLKGSLDKLRLFGHEENFTVKKPVQAAQPKTEFPNQTYESTFPVGATFIIDGRKQTLNNWLQKQFKNVAIEIVSSKGGNNNPESQYQNWTVKIIKNVDNVPIETIFEKVTARISEMQS